MKRLPSKRLSSLRALYTGSFDPLTKGHLDIIERSQKICDHLIIGIGVNESKTALCSLIEREEMLRKTLLESSEENMTGLSQCAHATETPGQLGGREENGRGIQEDLPPDRRDQDAAKIILHSASVQIITFTGLAVEVARQWEATMIIRGARNSTDFEYELQMASMNAALAPEIQTIILPSDPALRDISSRLVRQIAVLGGDVSSFVPAAVATCLAHKKFSESSRPTH